MTDAYGEPFARRYDDHAFMWRLYLPVVSDLLKKSTHPTVLDLGCGTGSLLTALAPLLESSLGIDISPPMIAIARQRARELGVRNVQFRVGDMQRMPIGRRFSTILCTDGVLPYLRDKKELSTFFSRLSALLEDEARALIEFWTPSANPPPRSFSTQLAPHTAHGLPDELLHSPFLCESFADDSSDFVRHRFYLPGRPYSFSLLRLEGQEALHRHRYYDPDEIRPVIDAFGFKIEKEYGIAADSGLPQLGPFSGESTIWAPLLAR